MCIDVNQLGESALKLITRRLCVCVCDAVVHVIIVCVVQIDMQLSN